MQYDANFAGNWHIVLNQNLDTLNYQSVGNPRARNALIEKVNELGQSLWCQNHLFLRFLLLNNLNRTAFKLRSSSIFFLCRLPFSSCFRFFLGGFSSLHTENQLPRLPQSGLKVSGWWWLWVPNHYQVKLKLKLRLTWAVTIIVPLSLP
jgi:hypothetical protein